ncbi:two-component system response regulator DevR [Rhodococcus sp. SMB37]|uniref:response regulator transcription factor n=1 Tax=Rhodococcus sp. SMB37 TaxID=2512213 RepID=UPI0010448E67|nr:response regulator transcription factor [Rhodococcus sp. SMB37]TCN42466.1 two-component system response regulator DevR [Rhodococcus sp. SMB37]
MTTVFLVDDHEVVRRGLRELLEDDPDLEVVGEAATVAQALARMPAVQPQVAVLDVRLSDGNGIELCRELMSRFPYLRCLMLTSFTDDRAVLESVLAGAMGYVLKDIQGPQIVRAVKEVGSGKSLLDSQAVTALMDKVRAAAPTGASMDLTGQERILLHLLGEGLTNRQIATRMFLSEKTIKNYVSRLLLKLGLDNRTQAALLAQKMPPPADHGGSR